MKRTLLALAILSSTTAYADGGFSNAIYIGDSLSDAGYFAPITQGKLGIAQSGKFTTNPDGVWTDRLSARLGVSNTANIGYTNQSGNNYAVGGARAGTDFTNETFGVTVPSAKTQVATYLAKGVDSNALHTVWIGANDLFAASADPTNAQSIILSAVADGTTAIGTLHKAGAKYIVVPTLPDVGLTPDFVGKATATTATATAQLFNTMLISQAKATGANIIPLDTFGLLQEVAKNPTAYGFDNMTAKACGETSSLLCGQANLDNKTSYFFADGVHPTGKAHRMIGDYAYHTVTAPTKITALTHIATQQGLALDETIKANAKNSTWASVTGYDGTLGNLDTDKAMLATLGTTLHHTDKSALGVYLGYTDASYKADGLTADMDEVAVGAYHQGNIAGLTTYANAGLGVLETDTTRRVDLDTYQATHTADGKGKRFFGTLGLAKPIPVGNATVSPYLSATAQSVRLDSLNEKTTSATALHFDEQKYQSTHGKAGVALEYALGKFKMQGDIYYQDRLSGDTPTPSASLATLPVRFETPKASFDKHGYGASFGVAGQVGQVDIKAGVRYYQADDDKLTSVGVSVGKRF